jgi:predicted nucleotidyltransferase
MKEIVERNKILQITTGSHLYGTNVATSDEDYVGIFIAPEKFYLGLSTVNEVDLSIVSKNVDGKNNSDAIDSKFYELRKFVRLALDNNPNVVEILFCNPENIIFKNSEAETLLSYAHLFPHQGCIQKFIGYSKSQLHKARVKPDNYKSLTDAKE